MSDKGGCATFLELRKFLEQGLDAIIQHQCVSEAGQLSIERDYQRIMALVNCLERRRAADGKPPIPLDAAPER